MSQECWYSSHLRHTDEFYPCIRPGLKKKEKKKQLQATNLVHRISVSIKHGLRTADWV